MMDVSGCPWYVRWFWQTIAFAILVLEFVLAKLRAMHSKSWNRRNDLFWLYLAEQEKKEAAELEAQKNKFLQETYERRERTAKLLKDMGIR
jgi:hypothetical protein